MAKSHIVEVIIVNDTGQDLVYGAQVFQHGQVEDDKPCPAVIPAGSRVVITCCESSAISGCSGWIAYNCDRAKIFFAFSNPIIGTNKVGIDQMSEAWDNMTEQYIPVSKAMRIHDLQFLLAYYHGTSGTTNKAVYTVSFADLGIVTDANLTLDRVVDVFEAIPRATPYRKYFKCSEAPTGITAFFQSHFKGLSVFRDKFIFTHTNIALKPAYAGKVIIADNLPGPGQAQTGRTFDTQHPDWAHPCSSQACGSFMAMGIQESESGGGADRSEIQILDIRGAIANLMPNLLGVIPRPTIGVNGVAMTKEIGPDGKYIVAAVNGNDLAIYKSRSSHLAVDGEEPIDFKEVFSTSTFPESGAGLALVTQTDGAIFLIALNADNDGSNNRVSLFRYDETAKEPLSPKLADFTLPDPGLSDSVKLAVAYSAALNAIIAGLFAKYGTKIFTNSFRWGKGLAITSNHSIELYASDRNVMPLSSIPAIGSDKDFSVMVWESTLGQADAIEAAADAAG